MPEAPAKRKSAEKVQKAPKPRKGPESSETGRAQNSVGMDSTNPTF